MRVAMYYNNRDVRLQELEMPGICTGELLIRAEACGICGSDVMEWYRIKKAPLVLGHEVTGQVVQVGQGVKGYKEGDRVFVSHHVPCNTCHYCLSGHTSVCDTLRSTNFDPGGFSEYIRIPEINVNRGVYLLPDDLSYEDGTFIEPLACVLRGFNLVGMKAGQSLLIIGCGITGLLQIKLACALGASRIFAVDINEFRLNVAKKFGAHTIMHATEDVPKVIRRYNDDRLADLVIVSTGSPSVLAQAWQSVDRGGTILLFAPTEPGLSLPVPFYELWRNEVTITTSYAANPAEIKTAIELLRERRVQVQPMITHRLGLADTGEGFRLVASAQDSIKVIIEPQR
ncbi:MAG: alcohol dehydrogenase catalytic domain-containing protein [Candidatus Tectomicrobia bacterium]|uniref:Alcohol dehydrogenase catalytic domain-containing protein n=1 Tax=Tectimicrobiota bacterium TaxID=2528274 RepID=A0A933GLB5_UNCTE|nr:alcohol dehydrogenase catalytic domain-containing protein [Candidatus Tectomicrobia bacterium]